MTEKPKIRSVVEKIQNPCLKDAKTSLVVSHDMHKVSYGMMTNPLITKVLQFNGKLSGNLKGRNVSSTKTLTRNVMGKRPNNGRV